MGKEPASLAATFSVKVARAFAERYREFCDVHCLQIGKFTEQALSEIMEDYYFGKKAQAVLSRTIGKSVGHVAAFRKPRPRRR